ncbi:hypothetical protein [Herbaspirillum sp. B65]|uniref:hypothetical protein n=1 Tax=Herbaspirillum sp. B65 TaxID=137708 RepID=UPI000349A88C|nr:hypothetical protein [Herbaspirillum sp. B65]
MNSLQKPHPASTGAVPAAAHPAAATHAASHSHGLSTGLIGLLASGAGLAVASLYYSQPMLGECRGPADRHLDFHPTGGAPGL